MLEFNRRILFLALLCFTAGMAAAGPSNVIRAEYRADTPFPQYTHLWQEGWSLKGPDGETIQYAYEGMPFGGYIHVYFKNPTNRPLEITDVLLDGVSLVQGIASSPDLESGYHPASIRFSKLPKPQIDRLFSAGEPVWWRVNPDSLPPYGLAELVIRLRRDPKPETLSVKLLGKDTELAAAVSVKEVHPRIVGIYFSPGLDTVYLYLRHPNGGGIAPAKIFLDGRDVTKLTTTAADKAADIVPAVIGLNEPLAMGSFHCFKAVYGDGSAAVAGIRAWGSDLVWGMWGYRREGNTPAERAKEYLMDMHEHNINVHMGMYGGSSKSFMESREGWDFEKSIGMRAMPTWFGNTSNPIMYFLQDEPDAQDFGVDGVKPFQRLGTLGMGLIEKSRKLRQKDAITPQLLNLDSTYKPENWYMYGQLPDILCADPYYQGQLDLVYNALPGNFAAHSKPTYVYAVGTICQSAGAPRPLHLILCSTKYLGRERPGRFPTPEEKRIEVYYALAAGAKGISFWWYTPHGDCYGCGAEDPEAVALWREIGLLGAEVRTAGPVITRSCPVMLPIINVTPRLWTRFLLSGMDTVVVIVVNDDIACDRVGTVFQPVEKASLTVNLPSWIKPSDVFEVTYDGTKGVAWDSAGSQVSLDLGNVELSRFIIVTADTGLRERCQTAYETQFASKVRRLITEYSE